MDMGISYDCLACSAEHCSWLQNIWHRQALLCSCQAGGLLHPQNLSQCIQEHCAETIDQLNEMDKAEDAIGQLAEDILGQTFGGPPVCGGSAAV